MKFLLRPLGKLFIYSKPFAHTLAEYFAKEAIGKKDSTLEKHGFYYNNVKAFFATHNSADIMLHEVKPRHMEALRVWLYETRPSCSKEHATRHIKHCIGAFEYARRREYKVRIFGIKTMRVINDIQCVPSEKDKAAEPVSLSPAEVRKLLNHKFPNNNYKLVIDLFLFQCFSGLSYMDLWLYEIVEDNNMLWITSPEGRGKNGNIYWSEYNDYAKAIHDRYSGKFPEITVQAYNRIIKAVALKLNIKKDLSTHNARKTFATLKYIQGHTLESISDQLGNDPKTTSKYYITKTNSRVKGEIERLADVPFLKAS